MARKQKHPWQLRRVAESPYYQVRFSVHGRQVERSTRRRGKKEAHDEALRLYTEEKSKAVPSRSGPLDQLVAEWLVAKRDEAKAANKSDTWPDKLHDYAKRLWLPRWPAAEDIDEQAIARYISDRNKKVSSVTLVKELTGLSLLLKFAKTHGWIASIPSWDRPKVQSNHQPVCLTRAEMMQVLAELPDRASHPKRHPVREYYTVLWATSFRQGTMARLRWSDVDLVQQTITVRPEADKNRLGRPVPLTDEAAAALRSLGPGVGYIFRQRQYRESLRSAARQAGIDDARADRLTDRAVRHSRITDLASRSKNLVAVRHMAGHKHLATTNKYVHSNLDGARDLLAETDGTSRIREVSREVGATEDVGFKVNG